MMSIGYIRGENYWWELGYTYTLYTGLTNELSPSHGVINAFIITMDASARFMTLKRLPDFSLGGIRVNGGAFEKFLARFKRYRLPLLRKYILFQVRTFVFNCN